MDILNMIQAPDNHILLTQLCLRKGKSDLSKTSKFKIFSPFLYSQLWSLKIVFKIDEYDFNINPSQVIMAH